MGAIHVVFIFIDLMDPVILLSRGPRNYIRS